MKYKKFQAPISKWDVLFKNDLMLWFVQKSNEKFLRFVIIFLWKIIYVYFYNWDKPLNLVLVVYDLIELIICVIVHIQMWCVCAQPYVDQTKFFFFFLFAFRSGLYHPYFPKFFKLFLYEKHVFWLFSWLISCISSTGS